MNININDNMSEDLKAAIKYLEKRNVSLDEKLDEYDGELAKLIKKDSSTNVIKENDIITGDIDLSNINKMFEDSIIETNTKVTDIDELF